MSRKNKKRSLAIVMGIGILAFTFFRHEADARQKQKIDQEFVHAVIAGDIQTVRSTLKLGADANARFEPNQSDWGILQRLFVSLRSKKKYFTALMYAAQHEDPVFVQVLIDHGADVNAVGGHTHATALMWAVLSKCHSTAALLIECGANVQARSSSGDTPLSLAKWNGDKRMEALLRRAGAEE